MNFTEIKKCRVCQGAEFGTLLDLGEQCIANAFHEKDSPPSPLIPLKLVRCHNCDLVQLAHKIDYDLMYKSYWYRSSINQTMRDHLKGLVESVLKVKPLNPGDTVLDLGCNDGFTLGCFDSAVNRVGVDPSNIVPANCNLFINEYFSPLTAAAVPIPKAKVITSIAMFYDLNEPRRFVEGIDACLDKDGIWVLELAYLQDILNSNSYDTQCHEHVVYYRLGTFEPLLDGLDLEVFKVEFNKINGGSFRIFVSRKGAHGIDDSVRNTRGNEQAGYTPFTWGYADFADRALTSKTQMQKFLIEQKLAGKKVYGYGASTKGQIIMQYCNITPDFMVAIAERNPDKYNLFTPGTNVRICSEDEMRAAKPDFLVIFPWYFLPEFREREKALIESGTRLVVPLPKFEVLPA